MFRIGAEFGRVACTKFVCFSMNLFANSNTMEVDRKANLKEIDKSVKNRFKWSWLEEKMARGTFFQTTSGN